MSTNEFLPAPVTPLDEEPRTDYGRPAMLWRLVAASSRS
jgi:hypothetical protein